MEFWKKMFLNNYINPKIKFIFVNDRLRQKNGAKEDFYLLFPVTSTRLQFITNSKHYVKYNRINHEIP